MPMLKTTVTAIQFAIQMLFYDMTTYCHPDYYYGFRFMRQRQKRRKLACVALFCAAVSTAVKPAAVQKNTVKPAAIEIMVRAYYYDYGNCKTNTEGTRFQSAFHSRRPELRYNDIFHYF